MIPNLLRTALITLFGGSINPSHKKSCQHIAYLASLACIASWIGWKIVCGLQFSMMPNSAVVILVAFLLCQLLLTTLLVSSPAMTGNQHIVRLLSILPVPRYAQVMVWVLPGVVLCLLVFVTLAPAALLALIKFGVPPLAAIITLLVSLVSAFLIAYGLPAASHGARILYALCVPGIEYAVIHFVYPHYQHLAYSLLAVVVISTGGLCWWRLTSLSLINQPNSTQHIRYNYPTFSWCIIKCSRNAVIRFSALSGLTLAVIIVGLCWSQHIRLGQNGAPLIGILCAAVAADFRGTLMRRPAEITALRGTSYFCLQHFLGLFCVTVLASMPLLIFGGVLEPGAIPLNIVAAAAGCGLGYLLGTLLQPTARDVSSQFVTACCASGIFIGLRHLPQIGTAISTLTPIYFITGACCLCIALLTEYKRNAFSWRKHS